MSAILGAIALSQIIPPVLAAGAAAIGLNIAVKSAEKTVEIVNEAGSDDSFGVDRERLENISLSDDWLDDGREAAQREEDNLYELWVYETVFEPKCGTDLDFARWRCLREQYGENYQFSDEQYERFSSRMSSESGIDESDFDSDD